MNKLLTLGSASLLLLGLNPVYASPSNDECSVNSLANCMNGVGPAVSSLDALRVTGSRTANQIDRESAVDDSQSLGHLGQGQHSGLAAGDHFGGLGVWASYNRAEFDSNAPIANAVRPTASYDATQNSFMVGVDKLFMNKLLFGISMGYEDTETDTAFNGGGSDANGYTFAPYVAYLINDVFSVDLMGGYSSLSTDTNRLDTNNGSTINGSFDSDRAFITANLNAVKTSGQWVFGGRIGYLYSEEDQDAYNETGGAGDARSLNKRHLDLAQLYLAGDIAYSFGNLEPYATVSYHNDLGRDDGSTAGGLPGAIGRTQPNDDDEYQIGFGFRYFGDQGVTANMEWLGTAGRDSFDASSLLFTLRMDM